MRLIAPSIYRAHKYFARHEHNAARGDVDGQRALSDGSTFCRNQLPIRTAVIFGVDRINSSICVEYGSSSLGRRFSVLFGGSSCRRYLRTVFAAKPRSRATTLIFSPSRRHRSRMVSQVSMVITPLGRPSRRLVVVTNTFGRGGLFMRSGGQFSDAAGGANLKCRFHLLWLLTGARRDSRRPGRQAARRMHREVQQVTTSTPMAGSLLATKRLESTTRCDRRAAFTAPERQPFFRRSPRAVDHRRWSRPRRRSRPRKSNV